MSRNLSASMITQITADTLAPVILVDLDFDGGNIYMWTGYGDLVWNADTYLGAGHLLSFSPAQEHQGVSTSTFNISFTPQAALLSAALGQDHRGRLGQVYFGAMSGTTLVDSPTPIFTGIMEPMQLIDEGTVGRIDLTLINRFSRMSAPKARRLNHQEQLRRFPGDLGLVFQTGIQEKLFTWSDVR